MSSSRRVIAGPSQARYLSLFLIFVLCVAGPTFANDTLVTLDAGGLVPVKSSKIIMESESLRISVHKVTVEYAFRNASKQSFDAVVAFPLPELDGQTLEMSPIELPSKNPTNFMDFEVTVDGVRVSPKVEMRAFKEGKDITDRLRSSGIPVSVLDPGMKSAIERLPRSVKDQFQKEELIVSEESNVGGKPEKWIWPWWQTRVRFYWTQHFASNSVVHVSHTYKPVVGGSYIVYDDDGAYTVGRYCGTEVALTRIRNVKSKLKKKQGSDVTLWERNIKYVLTTANNWSGPIRDFHLKIDADSPDDIVLTCMPGMKQVSPTLYVLDVSNFHPDRELDLMILQAKK